MTKFRTLLLLAGLSLSLASCITQKQYQEMGDKVNALEEENKNLHKELHALTGENRDLESEVERLQKRLTKLSADTLAYGNSLRRLNAQYDRMMDIQRELEAKYASGTSNGAKSNQALIAELENSQNAMMTYEESLRKLESELIAEKASLETSQAELAEKEARIQELQAMIAEKEARMNALRQRIEEALYSLKGEGLTLEQKQGKIYVRMEASLLFPSGSVSMNQKGKDAIIKLANTIENQEDLQIIVEGHTDTDGIKPGGKFADNWELSVLRATTVTKMMLDNSKIDPMILTASGQSEYHPVDPADKSKNRRIEIILSPDLDAIFSILEDGSAK